MKFCLTAALFTCNAVCLFAGTPELPFTIVENRGQVAASARLVGQGPGLQVEFEDRRVVVQALQVTANIEFVDALPGARVSPEAASGATINYLVGADAGRWKTNLTGYGRARYSNVWQGADVVFRAEALQVRTEFHFGTSASAGSVALRFSGAVAANQDGGLDVQTADGAIHLPAPEVYVEEGITTRRVEADWLVRGGNTAGLNLNTGLTPGVTIGIAKAAALVAGARTPSLLFGGYAGGSSQDNITAVAITTTFNIVVAGWTSSPDLPANGVRHNSGGGVDAFVASFSPVGGQLVYCTYLGGSGDDRAFGIAVDQAQNTYITGWTSSSNFPVVGAYQSKLSGARDAFVTKLNPTGTAIVYSTYLGGSGVDSAAAIAIDATGAAVIVGDTTSTNLPSTTGAYLRRLSGGQDVFVAKLNSAGNALTFLTWLGGSSSDHGTSIGLDAVGNVVVAGGTYSTDFPVTAGLQVVSGGGQDGFITKLAANGSALLWSTYIGGRGGSAGAPELVTGLSIALTGNITFAGITSSTNFPVKGNIGQPAFAGGQTDGFVAKLTGGNGVVYLATYIGGSSDDGVNAITSDARGFVYLTGYTSSTDFPSLAALQSSPAGSLDAFVVKMNSGIQVMYATYLGGSASDSGNAIAVDAMTSIVVAGSTGSPDFPVAGNLPRVKPGMISGFVGKIAPAWSTAITSAPTVFYDPWHINGFNGSTQIVVQGAYGQAGDITVTGDWDGTGVKRIGVFRNGLWILDTNGNGILDAADRQVNFGQPGDKPISGYFDGTGRPQLGLFRSGVFILDLSGHLTGVATGNSDVAFIFGQGADIPVAGDWNGSGTTKVGVFRNGTWLLDSNGDRALTAADVTYTFGQAGDVPVVGDWDNSGSATRIGVYRAGYWILDYAGDGSIIQLGSRQLYFAFGGPAYKPLVF